PGELPRTGREETGGGGGRPPRRPRIASPPPARSGWRWRRGVSGWCFSADPRRLDRRHPAAVEEQEAPVHHRVVAKGLHEEVHATNVTGCVQSRGRIASRGGASFKRGRPSWNAS